MSNDTKITIQHTSGVGHVGRTIDYGKYLRFRKRYIGTTIVRFLQAAEVFVDMHGNETIIEWRDIVEVPDAPYPPKSSADA